MWENHTRPFFLPLPNQAAKINHRGFMRVFGQTRCLAFCAFFLATGNASADYRFDVWTADLGLPQNSVRAIVQSADGYLWVATQDGLARFDGVRFTVFNKANTPSISDNRIRALYEDRESNLWIGLDDGHLVRFHRGVFTPLGMQDGLPGVSIQAISGGDDGSLWVAANDAFFFRKNGRFQPDPVASAALPNRDLIRGHRPGIIWTSNQFGVQIFSRGKLTTLGSTNGLPTLRINHIDEDQHGNWWLATEDAGLLKVRGGKVVKTFTQRDGLPTNCLRIRAGSISPAIACEDHDGNLWVIGAGPWLGCLKDGAFTAYPSTNTLTSQTLPLAPGQLASFINVLFEDREGNLWIGTEGCGLIRAREQNVNAVSATQGLHAVNIYPVFEDRAGSVWLGAWGLGLARVKDGAVTNFALGLPNADVTALCQDRAGRLWVGTMGGVFIFQEDKINLGVVTTALANQPVRAICEDHNGGLWFGAEAALFSYRNGELSSFTERDGLAKGYITAIIEDQNGALWFGGSGGLTRLAHGHFTTWTERDGLPSDRVRSLYQDSDGILWLGTSDGGLARFRDGKFTHYTTKEGMFDNGVFQILEDASGNLWMSSNRGIHRVSKRELNEFADGRRPSITSIAYGKSDGMLNPECNGGCWPSGVKTRDGRLWFPTQDGVAIINPERVPANTSPPPVVVEAFLLDRQPLSLHSTVRVPPGKANIEIHYTGLSFVNSERLRFKYRLADDDAWTDAGTRRTAYFSPLTPGKYTFRVCAANSDGVWNETGASLAFVVLPAWYQTWWFRSSGVLAIAGLSTFVYRRRFARLERARAAEQDFSRRLMESQEQERKRLAAELHDSVGQNLLVIKNRAVMALEHSSDPGRMSQQITEVSNMASHALREVRSMAQDLRPFQLDEMGLTKAILVMTRRLAESSKIQFHTDLSELDGELLKEDEIHFYRIVQELLTNIVKHSNATEANVTIRKAGPVLRALIQDNGCGFDANGSVSETPRQSGFGLRSIRERARTLRGRLEFHSVVGEGTTVLIEVPIEPFDETTAYNSNCRRPSDLS